MKTRLRTSLAAATAGLWLLSLFLPALGNEGEKSVTGINILIIGWLGISAGQFAWLGNLFLLVGVCLLTHSRPAVTWMNFVMAGLVLSVISAAFFTQMPGTNHAVVTRGPGYYIWSASLLILAISLLARVVAISESDSPD